MKADGDPCAQCGSPLAGDQRYCLNCGSRRGEPRVDYRARVASPPAEPAPEPLTEPEKPAKGERDYAPLAAVGGIAVLGLMLLVGVLIGRGDGGGNTAPAPAPIVVQGGGAAAGESEAGGAGEGEGAGGLGGGNSDGGKQQKNTRGGGKTETAADAGAVTASENQLEELQSETGEDAAKNALKLPDKIATPGAPPPIDKSKPPGGGEGGAVTIE